MDAEQRHLWLVLHRLPGLSDAIFRRLQIAANDAADILHATDQAWLAAGAAPPLLAQRRAWLTHADSHRAQQQALRDGAQLDQLCARLLPLSAPEYPPLLAEIHDPPPLLYLRGDAACLSRIPMLAIVGSRKASGYGLRAAAEFARDMVAAGYGICSGLAIGIDGAAHSSVLKLGGCTVAVMATGLDACYPARHRPLAERILAQGALLTAAPLGSAPLRERFPPRNRIISGLSQGVLVVEAASRSGTLITARMALEQNREVFALPHSIYHQQGLGCNALLAQGAKLVQGVADILEELPGPSPRLPEPESTAPTAVANSGKLIGAEMAPATAAVFAVLGYEVMSIDELSRCTACAAADVVSAITELQLLQLVEADGGGFRRI